MDYAAAIWTPDLDEGTVDCDLVWIISNECELSEPLSSCTECRGLFKCQRFDESIYFEDALTKIKIKLDMPRDENKGLCLPIRQSDFACNAYSGNVILAKRGGTTFWFCDPKFPAIVSKTDYFGDVTNDSLACGGGIGTLVNGITGIPWRETRDFEPILGVCRCPEPYVPGNLGPNGNPLGCVHDMCSPGISTQSGTCNCPDGFVECRVGAPAFDNEELAFHCPRAALDNVTRCVPDPCRPLGTFNHASGQCVPHNPDLHTTLRKSEFPQLPWRGHIVVKRTVENCPYIG